MRGLFRLITAAGLSASLAGGVSAADGRLYPSGPPNGVAYLRFVNMAAQEATVTSPAAKITLASDPAHRIREFDPVTPGVALAGAIQVGEGKKPIDLKLAPNEFVTVAVADGAEGPTVTVFREVPADFNAQKASLALFNLDKGCADAQLVAGAEHLSIVSAVAPGASGRRSVNPVAAALSVSCGDPAQSAPVALEPLAAGERYSIFVVAGGAGRQIIAARDEQAPFRP
jgi:alginate O-acetyltransferase complex protein AlgF